MPLVPNRSYSHAINLPANPSAAAALARNPASVIPTWIVDRKIFGSSANFSRRCAFRSPSSASSRSLFLFSDTTETSDAAKKALTREAGSHSDIPYVKDMEVEMLDKINCLGIGPGGLGGTTTALAVNINTYPTHIAGLPVAVNICCHVNRHIVRTI